MKCETCGADMPERDQEKVDFNGSAVLKQCPKCREETQNKMDEYPERKEKP